MDVIAKDYSLVTQVIGPGGRALALAAHDDGMVYGSDAWDSQECRWQFVAAYRTRGGWMGFALRSAKYGTFMRADRNQPAGAIWLVQAGQVDGSAVFMPAGCPSATVLTSLSMMDPVGDGLRYVAGQPLRWAAVDPADNAQLFELFAGEEKGTATQAVVNGALTVGGDVALACEAPPLLPITLAAQAQLDNSVITTDLQANMDVDSLWQVTLATNGDHSYAGIALVKSFDPAHNTAAVLAAGVRADDPVHVGDESGNNYIAWMPSPVVVMRTGTLTLTDSIHAHERELDLAGDGSWVPRLKVRTLEPRKGPSTLWTLSPGGRDWRWSATTTLPPGTTRMAPLASLAVEKDMHTYCFDGDRTIWRHRERGTAEWELIGAPAPASLKGTPIGCFVYKNRPYLHVVTGGGWLLQYYDTTGGDNWAWWNTEAPVVITGGLGAMIVNGRPHVFVAGEDGQVWILWYSDHWEPWAPKGHPPTGIKAVIGSTQAMGIPHVLVVAGDGRMWDLRQDNPTAEWTWYPCAPIPGNVRAMGGIAALTSGDRAYAWVQGEDLSIWAAWAPDGRTFGWSNQGGGPRHVAVGAGSVVYEDHPCVFMQMGDDLWMNWWGDDRGWRWSNRGPMPGTMTGAIPFGAVTADGRTNVAVHTESGGLGLYRYNPAIATAESGAIGQYQYNPAVAARAR